MAILYALPVTLFAFGAVVGLCITVSSFRHARRPKGRRGSSGYSYRLTKDHF